MLSTNIILAPKGLYFIEYESEIEYIYFIISTIHVELICDMYILYYRNVYRITGDITHHVCGIIYDIKTRKSIGANICNKLWTLSVCTEAAI